MLSGGAAVLSSGQCGVALACMARGHLSMAPPIPWDSGAHTGTISPLHLPKSPEPLQAVADLSCLPGCSNS